MSGIERIFFAFFLFCALTPGVSMASIINGSFESETHGLMPNGVSTSRHEEWGMPDDWEWRASGSTNGHGIRFDYAPFGNQIGWSSDEDWSLYVFASTRNNHDIGDFLEFYQTVDLTDQNYLLFDSFLIGGSYTSSYLSIDSQKLWTENQAGTYSDRSLDISSFSGLHEIRVGVEVFQPFGDSADGKTYFDNIRLIPVPGTPLLLLLGLFAVAINTLRREGTCSILFSHSCQPV